MHRCIPALIGLMTTGCLILPTAPFRMSPASRRLIPDRLVQSLEPGTATRSDVLLSLGAPEALLDGERIILYEWATESGIIAAGQSAESLNTHFYDLVFEFDDEGRLIQSGDLKTLLAEGFGRDRPFELSAPIEIPIQQGMLRKSSALILDRTELRIEKSGRSPRSFTIPSGGALNLEYRTNREARFLWPHWRRYDLRFRDESGQIQEEGFEIDVESLFVLVRYLHQHSPGIEIQD